MNHYDNYINERAKAKGKDPLQELEDFVFRYMAFISPDRKEEIINAHGLRAVNEKDRLKEFILSKNPYTVLKECFSPGRLHILAAGKEYNISPDLGLTDHELISELLYRFGFKNQVKPVGLPQIQNDIGQSLEAAQNITQLSLNDVRGICGHMADTIEEIIQVLFLFHLGALQYELDGRQLDELTKIVEEETDGGSQPAKKNNPEHLYNAYKKRKTKHMGHLVQFLKDLMDIFGRYYELRDYCQKNYRCDVPLTQNQLGQLSMFTAYRNIITHSRKNLNWEQNKSTAERGLSTMESNSDIHIMWQESWNTIVDAYNLDQDFPKHEMIQIMAIFVREFLDSLSKGIYPKVIVIRSYTKDEYGTVTIHADSSHPNDKKGIDFTDRNLPYFNFNSYTFTECYYHSRTNPIGIEPLLVPKDGLEKWRALQLDDGAENQEQP